MNTENQTLATELLSDLKEKNKQINNHVIFLFVIWLVTFIALVATVVYTIYLLNDISIIETNTNEQELTDINTIDGDIVNGGCSCGENLIENRRGLFSFILYRKE